MRLHSYLQQCRRNGDERPYPLIIDEWAEVERNREEREFKRQERIVKMEIERRLQAIKATEACYNASLFTKILSRIKKCLKI